MTDRLTERLALVATLDPDQQAAGAQTTDWVAMAKGERAIFVVMAGLLGASATLDAKLQEAKDGTGTSNQDLSGKAITTLVKATDDDKQAILEVKADELSAGYTHVACVVTVGVAASYVAVAGLLGDPRVYPASDDDLASVAEIVAD